MAHAVQYASNGCPLRSRSKKPGIYPPPVYVALFADGTEGRHSFFEATGIVVAIETVRRPYPGWRTMTAAQRYNARMERIFDNARARGGALTPPLTHEQE